MAAPETRPGGGSQRQPVAQEAHPQGEPAAALLRDRLDALSREVRQVTHELGGPVPTRLIARIESARRGAAHRPFFEVLRRYERLCTQKAEVVNRRTEIATSFASMVELRNDASAQHTGSSLHACWDTFENGLRRRRERELAAAYGSEDALLVNCGMAALNAAVHAAGTGPGDLLLALGVGYFQTLSYLETVLAPRGVAVRHLIGTPPQEAAGAAARLAPHTVLVETVSNDPGCAVAPPLEGLVAAGVRVVVDNAVPGHGARLFDAFGPDDLVVVESGSKYLTAGCACGVVYGSARVVDAARAYARVVGLQLQGRLVSRLQAADVGDAGRRLAVHDVATRAFVEELRRGGWTRHGVVSSAADRLDGREDAIARVLRDGSTGCLVFVGLHPGRDAAALDALLDAWAQRCDRGGAPIAIRDGFGWAVTSARTEHGPEGGVRRPEHIRVSVGAEPVDLVRRRARELVEAADALLGTGDSVRRGGACTS